MVIEAPYVRAYKEHPVVFRRGKILLSWKTCPENENGIFNPAALAPIPGALDQWLLYPREENKKRESVIGVYSSPDGVNNFRRVRTVLEPTTGWPDSKGCEDGRAFYDDHTGLTYLVYVGHNGETQINMLAVSNDFYHFRKLGPMFDEEKNRTPHKDAAIKGRNLEGKIIATRRPMDREGNWGIITSIADRVEGPYTDIDYFEPRGWMGDRIGPSEGVHIPGFGFMDMIHGAHKPNGHHVYEGGLTLANEYGEIIACSREPLLVPETDDERDGTEGKEVVLPTGFKIVMKNGVAWVRVYYGAGDRHIRYAEAPVKDCISHLSSRRCMIPKSRRDIFSVNSSRNPFKPEKKVLVA